MNDKLVIRIFIWIRGYGGNGGGGVVIKVMLPHIHPPPPSDKHPPPALISDMRSYFWLSVLDNVVYMIKLATLYS